MRTLKTLRFALVATACLGLVCPRPVSAADVQNSKHVVPVSLELEHVALQDGLLQGALVDTNGKPLTGKKVVVAKAGNVLVSATTNEEGRFAVKGLENGVYQIVSTGKAANYRVYESAAPAAAKQGVIHVLTPEMARANLGGGGLNSILGNTSTVALTTAAVVAIGAGIAIAVNNDNNS